MDKADSLFVQQRFEEAIAAYTALASAEADAKNASALMRVSRFAEAAACAERATSADPASVLAWNTLGLVPIVSHTHRIEATLSRLLTPPL